MFDYIICNPPYLKIGKEAPEALVVPEINYGAPNLYSIFASLCFFDLKTNGQLVLIFPRSWTSGAYFEHFRSYLFSCGCIRKLHLFISRSEVFNDETVLQETMIMRFDKTLDENSTINISSTSSSKDFTNIQSINVPSNLVVHGAKHFVFLLTSPEDIEVFLRINKFTNTLLTDGLKMKTGIVVDFRTKEVLHCDYEKGLLPLFYPQHMKNGKIIFPLKNGTYEYIDNSRKCLLQSNKNYLFVKRFTSKEESRRLQCAIYSKEDFPQYPSISTQNKINFIEKIDGSELNLDIIYGLFVIFNSSDYDSYYRILNGSTQVNSTEINALPMPSISQIELIGKECRKQKKNCTQACDKIMEELLWQRS
jgi:adenine-specific DNA-methyltransferase